MTNDLVINMTVGDLRNLVAEVVKEQTSVSSGSDAYAKGVEGLRYIFQCGTNKAIKIKDSGIIDKAIIYNGSRSFITHIETARRLWKEYTDKVKKGVIV